jgi:glucose dehydrogenase
MISLKGIAIGLLFFFSSIGASVLISPAGASPNSPVALAAATPLSQLQANWAFTDGNQFAQDYSPQTQINSSNAQYLGISWLFPLPTLPSSLLSVGGGVGVDTTPLIINGTIYVVTTFGQVFALNAANGNQVWTDVLPILPNSTAGLGAGRLSLHAHQGSQTFTTTNFGWNSGGTATYWIAAPNFNIYAINALNGKYEMNFTYWHGMSDVQGNSPTSVYGGLITNIVIDSQRGILITGMQSSSNSNAARGFNMGWNINVNPPQRLWTSYYSPPQPNSNLPLDPTWTIKQVNNMTGAQIFYPGPAYNAGGTIPGSAVVDLKTLPAAQLNATLYDDWGQVNQSPACKAATGGQSTGAVGMGWGGSWVLDQKTGIAYVNTGNRAPYVGPCTPGPDLWASSVLALNDQTGSWVWGFQTSAHDNWDWDCSWYQGLGNETIAGSTTEVLWKTCKNGYIYELNAATGKMIWAWTPPTPILLRCMYCFMQDPLNRTTMTNSWPAPNLQNYLMFPSLIAGFESTAAYSPVTNMIYVTSHNAPADVVYVALNSTNYAKSALMIYPKGFTAYPDNATTEAVNAATGQMVWSHNIPSVGFRGGMMTSGNVVYAPLASGDVMMLNAQTGAVIKDMFVGAPMSVVPAIGATISGTEEVILTVGSGFVFGTSAPGDIVALQLQNLPATNTVTTTATATTTLPGQVTTLQGQTVTTTATTTVSATGATTTSVTTVTTSSGGVDATTVYGIAVVAVILAISTGYLAMKGRKPGP